MLNKQEWVRNNEEENRFVLSEKGNNQIEIEREDSLVKGTRFVNNAIFIFLVIVLGTFLIFIFKH